MVSLREREGVLPMTREIRLRCFSVAAALGCLLLTLSTALAAPPDAASGQVAAAPFGTTPPVYATPTPTPVDVFLSGSRYWSGTSISNGTVGYYVTDVTASSFVQHYLQRVMCKPSNANAVAAFTNFATQAASWPSSLPCFQANMMQTAGITSILDGKGNVLGTLDTFSLIANGIPGLSYMGNPWGNGSYNQVYLGPSVVTLTTLEGTSLTLNVLAFVSVSPIIIDLQGDGKPDVDNGEWRPHPQRFNLDRARMFDIDGCGEADLTEWVGPKSGLLVAPADEVKVAGGRQLFGTAVGFVDGYQKLALLRDKNHDGQITGPELEGLKVWVDANQDGKCQPDELRTVQQVGIESIRCTHTDMKSDCVIRGQKRLTWDWWPTVAKVSKAASR